MYLMRCLNLLQSHFNQNTLAPTKTDKQIHGTKQNPEINPQKWHFDSVGNNWFINK